MSTLEDLAREFHQRKYPSHSDCGLDPVELQSAQRVLDSDWLAKVRRDAWDEGQYVGYKEAVYDDGGETYGMTNFENPYAEARDICPEDVKSP